MVSGMCSQFQSLIGLILTHPLPPPRGPSFSISIPYRSYSNGEFECVKRRSAAISIPYRSYSNTGFEPANPYGTFISIPYRSYSNLSLRMEQRYIQQFQSLIGLILTPPAVEVVCLGL